jgi:hypothetical protein
VQVLKRAQWWRSRRSYYGNRLQEDFQPRDLHL